MPRSRTFTPSVAAEIVAAYRNGETIAQIARRHQCSTAPVRRVLLEAGEALRPTGRRWPFDRATEEEMVAQYEAGITLEQLVTLHGGTNRSVRLALVNRGVAIRRPGRRKKKDVQ